MNRLPKDLIKRKKWITNCEKLSGMKNWSPLDSAALCEYHFITDMWEKPQVDGKKKLKCDAVPTIFGDLVFQVKEKVDGKVVTDVDTEEVLVQTTTESLTKEVHLLPFSNIRKCEFSPNTSEAVTKKSKLLEPVNTDSKNIIAESAVLTNCCLYLKRRDDLFHHGQGTIGEDHVYYI